MPEAASIVYQESRPDAADRHPPVVLVHGAGGHALHWPPQLRRLPGYRVLAVDLPGHGRSPGAGCQRIADYVAALRRWADAIHLPPAVWVGHSMGGAIVQTLALQYPERVQALVLIGTGARLRVHPTILQGTADEATFLATVDTIISWAFAPESDPRLRQLAAQRMAETRPAVLHGDFVACDAFDIRERLAEINHPTLVLCGEQDRMTPPRYAEYLAEHLPNARLVRIPAAGHMVMLEQPDVVARALRAFLDELSAPA